MVFCKELVDKVAEALINIETNASYYFDKEKQEIVEFDDGHPDKLLASNYLKIEPMLKDLIELMEDFALQQDSEDIQHYLHKLLQNRDARTSIKNFRRALHDYQRSKKRWDRIEKKWLQERAFEFLSDVDIDCDY